MDSILIDPQDSGLGAAASVIGKLSAPSRLPVGLGSILGQAGGAYMGAKDQATSMRENLEMNKAVRLARSAEIAERTAALQDAQQKKARFNSVLGKMQESGEPIDEISILGAGISSGAFGPKETTEFMSKVVEKKAAREQQMEQFKLRLEDQKLSREEREAAERRMAQFRADLQRDNMRLAAALKPAPQYPVIQTEQGVFERRPEGLVQLKNPVDGAPLKPKTAAGGKPPAEIQRMNVALGAMDQALTNYENLMKDFDPRTWDQVNPSKRAQIEAAVSALQLEWKEAAALGALTGPDLEIMEKTIVRPGSFKGAFYGKEGLGKQIEEGRGYIKRRKGSISKMYPTLDSEKAPWER